MSSWSNPPRSVPGQIDNAESFDGSGGETVTNTDTRVSGGNIELDTNTSSSTTVGSDSGTDSNNNDHGFVYSPSVDTVIGLSVTLPTYSGDLYVSRRSDGQTLASKTGLAGNNDTATVEFDAALDSTSDYLVTYRNSNNNNRTIRDNTFPVSTANGEIVAGWTGSENSSAFHFVDVASLTMKDPGSAIVEWPYPAEVYEWAGAYFEATDGVSVYVEDGAGNELAGPIESGDSIPASSDTNVRFRADFTVPSSGINPTLFQIARREVFKG